MNRRNDRRLSDNKDSGQRVGADKQRRLDRRADYEVYDAVMTLRVGCS